MLSYRKLSTEEVIKIVGVVLILLVFIIIYFISAQINNLKKVNENSHAAEMPTSVSLQGNLQIISGTTSKTQQIKSYELVTSDKNIYIIQSAQNISYLPPTEVTVKGTMTDNLVQASSIVADGIDVTSSSSTALPLTGYQVSGQVLDVGLTRPSICPSSGYMGLNAVNVLIWGTGFQQVTTTAPGGSNQDGAFYFNGVPNGIYNVCYYNVPIGYQWYCTVQSDPSRNPFTSHCNRITVNGANVPGNRIILGRSSCSTTTSATGVTSSSSLPGVSPASCTNTIDIDAFEHQTVDLINQRRQAIGLSPLTFNNSLRMAGRQHATRLGNEAACYHDTRANTVQRIINAGYSTDGSFDWAETIHCLTNGASSPDFTVTSFWNSPEHHAILTDTDYRDIGCGWWVNNDDTMGRTVCDLGRHLADPTLPFTISPTPTGVVSTPTPLVTQTQITPTPSTTVPTPTSTCYHNGGYCFTTCSYGRINSTCTDPAIPSCCAYATPAPNPTATPTPVRCWDPPNAQQQCTNLCGAEWGGHCLESPPYSGTWCCFSGPQTPITTAPTNTPFPLSSAVSPTPTPASSQASSNLLLLFLQIIASYFADIVKAGH